MRLYGTRRDVQLYALLQIAFEVCVDLFVFLWAPGIPPEMNTGAAFAALMAGLAAGSCGFGIVRELYTQQ